MKGRLLQMRVCELNLATKSGQSQEIQPIIHLINKIKHISAYNFIYAACFMFLFPAAYTAVVRCRAVLVDLATKSSTRNMRKATNKVHTLEIP